MSKGMAEGMVVDNSTPCFCMSAVKVSICMMSEANKMHDELHQAKSIEACEYLVNGHHSLSLHASCQFVCLYERRDPVAGMLVYIKCILETHLKHSHMVCC